MTCLRCQHDKTKKAGTTAAGTPRFACKACGARFSPPQPKPLGYHRTSVEDAVHVFTLLFEGMSIRATSRATGIDKDTISTMLLTMGDRAASLFDERVRNLRSKRIQCDEMWGYCYAKRSAIRKNPKIAEKHPDAGDVWLWTAIDADSKLIASFHVGDRNIESSYTFMSDLESRLKNRVQLTTDNLQAYRRTVDSCFAEVDFAMLHKVYSWEAPKPGDGRYSPPRVIATHKKVIIGDPNPAHISTSYVERHNLTIRMQLRRFTRLTNGFSKKRIYLEAAVALFMAYYNFCRVHSTLRVTPAMAAGLTDTVWSVADLLTYQPAQEQAA